jgi:hypothetical protein
MRNQMKKIFILFSAFSVCILSCAGTILYSQEQFNTVQNKINAQEITYSGGDGSAFENAMIITGATNDTDLAVAELLFVSNKIGIMGKDWKLIGQYPINKEGFNYASGNIDLVDIMKLKDKSYESFYFNKSSLIQEQRKLAQEQKYQEMIRRQKGVKDKIANHDITFLGGDGLSMETAIVIKGAKNGQEGVDAEYVYISIKQGQQNVDWKPIEQSLLGDNGKSFDCIKIEDIKNSTKISYYFDVTAFFGKR